MKTFILTIVSLIAFYGCAGKSHQIDVELVKSPDVDMSLAVQRLSEAIQIKTVSYSDTATTESAAFDQINAYFEESFPLTHSALDRQFINTHSLLYTWKGTNLSLNPVVLLSHTDVVPADTSSTSRWNIEPFAGKVKDDILWGRGTVDDKSSVLGIFESVELLLSQNFQPERTIILAFGHDEEIGGKSGAHYLAEALRKQNITPAMILDEGGAIVEEGVPGVSVPVALIGIAEKGYLSLELSVEGVGGHSSMPPKETAITVLSKAIAELSDNPMPATLEGPIKEMLVTLAPETAFPFNFLFSNLWAFGGIIEGQLAASSKSNALIRTTTAPTIFHAGVKDNQLPQVAIAVVNFRLKPGDSIDDVIDHVKAVIDNPNITVQPIGDFPQEASDVSNYKTSQYNAIAKSIRQTFPEVLVTPYLTVGGTDTKHYKDMTDQIYRFLPIQFTPEQLDGMHGVDEHITRLDYERVITFYIQFILNATGPERLF